jgi:hypothetical protein
LNLKNPSLKKKWKKPKPKRKTSKVVQYSVKLPYEIDIPIETLNNLLNKQGYLGPYLYHGVIDAIFIEQTDIKCVSIFKNINRVTKDDIANDNIKWYKQKKS